MLTPGALKQLASLQFHCVTPPENEPGDPLECLPFIIFDNASFPARHAWRMPSVGDIDMDMHIGQTMALGYLVFEVVADGNDAALNLAFIVEAMQNGNASEHQQSGFFSTLERFTDCALHHPEKFTTLRDRLKRLTDEDLNARYRSALRGATPSDFFADEFDGLEGGSK